MSGRRGRRKTPDRGEKVAKNDKKNESVAKATIANINKTQKRKSDQDKMENESNLVNQNDVANAATEKGNRKNKKTKRSSSAGGNKTKTVDQSQFPRRR